MVKVIQERHVKPGRREDLVPLVRQLRLAVANQPGYITGETLVNAENPDHQIVIGTFRSYDDWKDWVKNKERRDIYIKIKSLLTTTTKTTVCNVFQWKTNA